MAIVARDLGCKLRRQNTLGSLQRVGPGKQFINGRLRQPAAFDLTVLREETEVDVSENVSLNGMNLCDDLPLVLLFPSFFQPKHLPGEKLGNLHQRLRPQLQV